MRSESFNFGSVLNLGATNSTPTLSIEVRVTTNLCPNGAVFYYSLNYTYDPYIYLAEQASIADFADGNTTPITVTPLYSLDANENPLEFNDSPGGGTPGILTNPNGSITITDASSSSLPIGDSLVSMDVTLSDGTGGEHTLTISTGTPSVIFNNGNGGLALSGGDNGPILNGDERKTFTIVCKIHTMLCPDGVTFVYSGRYTASL